MIHVFAKETWGTQKEKQTKGRCRAEGAGHYLGGHLGEVSVFPGRGLGRRGAAKRGKKIAMVNEKEDLSRKKLRILSLKMRQRTSLK